MENLEIHYSITPPFQYSSLSLFLFMPDFTTAFAPFVLRHLGFTPFLDGTHASVSLCALCYNFT
jgi:hypothetical protein